MAVLETHVRTRLTAAAAVAAIVGRRVRPLRLAQAEGVGPRPCLVFSVGDDEVRMTMAGPGAHRKAELEVTSYADTHDACAALARAVKAALHGYAGTADGVKVAVAIFAGESATEEARAGQEGPVYVRTQVYRVLYREV